MREGNRAAAAGSTQQPLFDEPHPIRVLEVGPGTGAVTRSIVRLLRPGDRLDLVELNAQFADVLRRRFEQEPEFAAVAAQSHVHACALQDFPSDGNYDFIISGLPLTSFAPETVSAIYDACFRLLLPGGVLSYFEYIFLRRLRRLTSRGPTRQEAVARDAVIDERLSRFRFRRDRVLVNLPPAWVHHLRQGD